MYMAEFSTQFTKQSILIGVTIQSKLNWKPHINNITKKDNNVRAFLQRNLSNCPRSVKEQAYKTYVLSCHMYWPTLQWSQTVRDGAHGLVQSKCAKANLNLCGSLIVAILSGSEFQSFIVLGKKEYL